VPATALVELTQIGEQPMHRRIEMRRLLRNPLAQLLKLILHDECISRPYDILSHSRERHLAR